VTRASLYVVINDVTPPAAWRSPRTLSSFDFASFTPLTMRVSGQTYSCVSLQPLMPVSLLDPRSALFCWIGMSIALLIHGIGTIIALMLPETLNHKNESKSEASDMRANTPIYIAYNARQPKIWSQYLSFIALKHFPGGFGRVPGSSLEIGDSYLFYRSTLLNEHPRLFRHNTPSIHLQALLTLTFAYASYF
jgi:hypothetical protein